jgi:hypothetical protein
MAHAHNRKQQCTASGVMGLQPKRQIEINIPTSTNYMKHNHAAEDYANGFHKEIDAIRTKFNWVPYFNLNCNHNFNFILKYRQAVQ